MKDVAELAGVSVSTVSRVINGNFPVEQATIERVERAVKKLGYTPNLLAKGLRTKTGFFVGFIVPKIRRLHALSILLDSAEQSALTHGWSLILGSTRNNRGIEKKVVTNLIKRHVDGIILYGMEKDCASAELLKGTSIPTVFIHWKAKDQSFSCVNVDNRKAGQLAAQHLIDLGHSRVGCVTGLQRYFFCEQRLRGFEEALKVNRISFDPDLVFEGDFTVQSGVRAAEYFLQQKKKPTAVWCANDLMAIGIIKGLNRHGLKVPQEMSVVGMDDSFYSELSTPALTTIRQPFEAMCEQAFELIRSEKESSQRVAATILLEPTLIVRESTARARE